MLSMLLIAAVLQEDRVATQFQHDWQLCVTQTAELWAAKPGLPENIVDAALVRCRDEFEQMTIAQTDNAKKIGLNTAQADEYVSFLAAGLIRIVRPFATNAVTKARGRN